MEDFNTMNSKERIECRVTGRVQMVMFRDFTRRTAKKLGVVGTVENLSDGSVYVVAEGEKDVLEKLVRALRKGSLLARVENVEVEYLSPTDEFADFRILY